MTAPTARSSDGRDSCGSLAALAACPRDVGAGLDDVTLGLLRSKTGALAWWRVRHSPLRDSPAGERLLEAYRNHAFQTALHARNLVQIVTRLRAGGVEPVLVKGPAIGRCTPSAACDRSGISISACARISTATPPHCSTGGAMRSRPSTCTAASPSCGRGPGTTPTPGRNWPPSAASRSASWRPRTIFVFCACISCGTERRRRCGCATSPCCWRTGRPRSTGTWSWVPTAARPTGSPARSAWPTNCSGWRSTIRRRAPGPDGFRSGWCRACSMGGDASVRPTTKRRRCRQRPGIS